MAVVAVVAAAAVVVVVVVGGRWCGGLMWLDSGRRGLTSGGVELVNILVIIPSMLHAGSEVVVLHKSL